MGPNGVQDGIRTPTHPLTTTATHNSPPGQDVRAEADLGADFAAGEVEHSVKVDLVAVEDPREQPSTGSSCSAHLGQVHLVFRRPLPAVAGEDPHRGI